MKASNDNRDHKINEHSVTESQMSALALADNAMIHFGQSAEDSFLLRFFYQKKNGFYVDIGAYSPTRYSNTFILHHLYGWRGINLDASADVINEFNKSRPDDINICSAVGRPSSRTFYRFSSSARNTLSENNIARQQSKGDVSVISKEKMAVQSLDSILKKHLPKGKQVDVLDIDVEGLEMEVLESNDWNMYRPRLILLEDYSMGEGKIFESDLYKFMTDMKYRLVSHHFDTSFYVDTTWSGNELEQINRGEFINNLKTLESKYGGHMGYQSLVQERQTILNDMSKIKKHINDIENSLSWKITRPLRSIRRFVSGL